MGDLLDERFYADLERDQAERATMSMLVPPQMLNTMVPCVDDARPAPRTEAFYADPVRRYMLPVLSDRRTDWPSHPHATRDSLHEHDMWVAEGLTHRYPTKVLAELLPTCPQYCGHCTRMDLVGNSTPPVDKLKFDAQAGRPVRRDDRLPRAAPRASATSSSPAATWPTCRGGTSRRSSTRLLEIENIRDIRLATKALMGLPQHWLQADVVEGMERVATTPRGRGVNLAIHTHVNHAAVGDPAGRRGGAGRCSTPACATCATRASSCAASTPTTTQLLDLCFALLDDAGIMPYYFYMCDMIPNAEHWRVVGRARPGAPARRSWATCPASPRRGSSATCRSSASAGCTSSRRTTGSAASPTGRRTTARPSRPPTPRRSPARTPYYDPIDTLPESGQQWWAEHGADAAQAGREDILTPA